MTATFENFPVGDIDSSLTVPNGVMLVRGFTLAANLTPDTFHLWKAADVAAPGRMFIGVYSARGEELLVQSFDFSVFNPSHIFQAGSPATAPADASEALYPGPVLLPAGDYLLAFLMFGPSGIFGADMAVLGTDSSTSDPAAGSLGSGLTSLPPNFDPGDLDPAYADRFWFALAAEAGGGEEGPPPARRGQDFWLWIN